MFDNTLDISVGGVTKTLNRVADDGYTSEYLLKDDGVGDYRLKIRHSTYVDKTRGVPVDRHNVELSYLFYADPGEPNQLHKAYVIFENDARVSATYSVDRNEALVDFLTDANLLKLHNWES